ncbi:ComEC/Rec2 family competence protein [Methylocapsa acidiphila]|uniref:ComEC/Rec2 family competence protein n=1 Tax=Methylocapsa acidiphila TaxID=133552 RepID=UPI000425112F|nr:ComEC/Rec2 family competence protein [Methylocapsa acidiphila]
MAETAGTAIDDGGAAKTGGLAARLRAGLEGLLDRLARDFETETEIALRRLFLWLPVAAGAGVLAYFYADREPSLWLIGPLTALFAGLAWFVRDHRLAFFILCGLCAFFAGELSAAWRTACAAAPVIDRVRIATVEGYVEQMDFRRAGARFILRIVAAEGLARQDTPFRVRLSIRRTPPFDAGAYVRLKARLLPPARASLPGGYDFARDAWFARLGAVGNALGRIELAAPPAPPGPMLAAMMALDRGRNALARRIDAIVGGDAGAIAAAMVTGKRDLLSESAKDVIREAGIFHIITISGVQMTLVAAIFFVGLRRLLALSGGLALRYPIKKWAAAAAMAGAIFYDVATGSRVGTERALFMTLIMLGAVLLDRQALTMRNLAFAALIVILLEPEAIMGASFQLSFAAVAALVAVYEGRIAAKLSDRAEPLFVAARPVAGAGKRLLWEEASRHLQSGPAGLLFATFCATSATASFMAFNFHELSPYVLIGNPLTLTVIEIFAVPGALLGALLYPLGLDPWVWRYVGFGIDSIMFAARKVGELPGATIHLPAFAPWAIVFLTLALLSIVLWRTLSFRAMAVPLVLIGLLGAASGPAFDLAVAASGDSAALRGPDGRLAVIGLRPSLFAAEQWLRADADGRAARAAVQKDNCDRLGCVGRMAGRRTVALVLDRRAFAEDCARADIIVTPYFAPFGCAAGIVIDREKLKQTGALALSFGAKGVEFRTARAADEDRPWSRAPKRLWGRAPQPLSLGPDVQGETTTSPVLEQGEADDGAPLD